MNAYIESLILYTVLFLRIPASPPDSGDFIAFSSAAELVRITLYNIPSLALIWYLLLKVKGFAEWGLALPARKDIVPAAIALPCLAIVGFTVSAASHLFTEIPSGPRFLPPGNAAAWILLALSCISTGYLEESFFRFYLLSKREKLGLGPMQAIVLSTLLFSFCHVYEGPWGFLNAVLSGAVLAFVFLRFRSLHGIALAHGLYNIAVYALALLPD